MEHTSNAKILIADENAAQRTQLRESLTRAGYRNVEEAVNGDDALHKIDRLHPDIAIIDIWLSKLDGIGVIRAAHNLDFRNDREPAYIITSPVSNQNMFIQAAGAGAQLCLIKPIRPDSLSEHVEELLRNRNSAPSGTNVLLVQLVSQPQVIGDHGNEFRVGRFSAAVLDGIAKVSVERIHITPIPRHFNSMTDGAFHARGGRGVLLGNRGVQYLRY